MENADTPPAYARDEPYCPHCGWVMAVPTRPWDEDGGAYLQRLSGPVQVTCSNGECGKTSMAVIFRRM